MAKGFIKVVYKVTYPNGKIYVGQDVTDSINNSTAHPTTLSPLISAEISGWIL